MRDPHPFRFIVTANGGDGALPVVKVLEAAMEVGADLVLLCGDTFDNHKVPLPLVARVADLVREAGIPTVILPGNHDPAMEIGRAHV